MNPIVLAHGLCGFRKMVLWGHFHRVADTLRVAGYPVVHTAVHPTLSIQERGAELQKQIEHELGPDQPCHIIAHSMGGLDSRYLASPGGLNQGHRIRSITTIGTPHRGSPIAARFPRALAKLTCYSARVGQHLPFDEETRAYFSRLGENRTEGLEQLTPDYIRNHFNPATPDHPDVEYISYAGKVEKSDLFFPRTITWQHLYHLEGDNDAMVSVQSATWGELKEVVHSDHGSLVGLQIIPGLPNRFDHLAFYLKLAGEIRERYPDSSKPAPGVYKQTG